MEREEFRDYVLFFTFFVAAAYLLLRLIPGRTVEPSREPEAV